MREGSTRLGIMLEYHAHLLHLEAMNVRSTIGIIVAMLSALLLLGGQVFGLERGFICRCGGEPVRVQTYLCSEMEHDSGHSEEDHHPHEQIKLDILCHGAPACDVTVPTAVLSSILTAELVYSLATASFHYLANIRGGPPPDFVTHRTIVLLI
jgi:hypothetical protein